MKLNLTIHEYKEHARVFKRCVEERIPVEYTNDGVKIEFGINYSIDDKESYRISLVDGGWKITGSDELGLFYGIGKFLHSAKWTEDEFIPNPPEKVMNPACSFRAIYFATHFYNWYQMASMEEMQEYLEDMLLWGYNTVICIIPIVNIDSFEEPLFFDSIARTRRLFKLAKNLGMKIGIIINVNQGLRSASDEMSADLSFDTTGKIRGWLGKNLCLSKEGTLDYLKQIWIKMFEQYTDIELDYIMTWPYDEGGCGCKNCRPWGANAYCELAKEMHKEALKYYPNAEFIVSTWLFDEPHDQGEFEGFYQRLKGDMSWVDYILVDSHDDFPRYPLEHEVIKPIINFPEISMWRLSPWGGRGASPMPQRFQRLWDSAKHILKGGMPYSEGIYEDISKVQYIGYYWEPDKNYKEILSEYIGYEYSSKVCDEVIELLALVEKSHVRVANVIDPDYEAAERAVQLAEKVNVTLGTRAKESWRWRIVYIRTWIDKIIYQYYRDNCEHDEKSLFELRHTPEAFLADNEKAQQLLQELCLYYHCVSENGENKYTRPPVKDGKVWDR